MNSARSTSSSIRFRTKRSPGQGALNQSALCGSMVCCVDQPVQHHPTEGEPRCSEYPEPKLARGVQERNNLSPQGIPLRESPCLACLHDELMLASARSTYGHNRWVRRTAGTVHTHRPGRANHPRRPMGMSVEAGC